MEISVQLYASLAEAAGARRVRLTGLPDAPTVGDLGDAVFERLPQLAALRDSVIFVVNEEYVTADFPISADDEVALIPPVSGGDDAAHFLVTDQPLDIQALHALVVAPAAGAVSLFVGVVRETNLGRAVDYLEYDAYPAMATTKMRAIAAEIEAEWDVTAVAMHHRTGRLEIGEASVVIAVASAHRREAIAACEYGIDRLKQIVPIWKKEVWTDGEHWIEGSLVPAAEAQDAPAAEPPPQD